MQGKASEDCSARLPYCHRQLHSQALLGPPSPLRQHLVPQQMQCWLAVCVKRNVCEHCNPPNRDRRRCHERAHGASVRGCGPVCDRWVARLASAAWLEGVLST